MTRKNLLWILPVIFIILETSFSQDPQTLFQQANTAYQNQQFEEAAEFYQRILSQGYQSTAIYYNLGNCYFRLNEIGEAVLYYEKALRLDPLDADVRYNLELANLRVLDRIELPPRFFLFDWWDIIVNYYSPEQLTGLLSISFIITIGLIIMRFFLKRDRWRVWILSLTVVMALVTVFCTYLLVTRSGLQTQHHEGVVTVPVVIVLSAPDLSSTEMFVLHEGVKVRLDETRTDWIKISLPDGKSGWIKSEEMGII